MELWNIKTSAENIEGGKVKILGGMKQNSQKLVLG